jgi:hypothetical protein
LRLLLTSYASRIIGQFLHLRPSARSETATLDLKLS